MTIFIPAAALALIWQSLARADDLCSQLNNVPAVEKFFATHQVSKLDSPVSPALEDLKLEVTPPGPNSGSCRTDELHIRSRKDDAEINVETVCDYNGCMFGRYTSLVEWRDRVFVVAMHHAPRWLDSSREWKSMSELRRSILEFRNLVFEIYELTPNHKLQLRCSYGYDNLPRRDLIPSNERAFGHMQCEGLRAKEVPSIFPKLRLTGYEGRVSLPDYCRSPENCDTDKIASVDLDGDGLLEIVTPHLISSSAGCGCDRTGLLFLDEAGHPTKPKPRLAPQLNALSEGLECSEHLDIVVKDQKYWIVKRSGGFIRSIYPIAGNADTPPSCMLVNSSPLALKPQ